MLLLLQDTISDVRLSLISKLGIYIYIYIYEREGYLKRAIRVIRVIRVILILYQT